MSLSFRAVLETSSKVVAFDVQYQSSLFSIFFVEDYVIVTIICCDWFNYVVDERREEAWQQMREWRWEELKWLWLRV